MTNKETSKKNKKFNPKTERMVRAIQHGDNVKAYKCLEQLIKERVAQKIEEVDVN